MPPRSEQGPRESLGAPRITARAAVLGVLTIVAALCYVVYVGQGMRVGSYVHSQFPMAVFMPFVLWICLNVLLVRLWPKVALSQGELLTILTMLWIVGTIPQLGWMNYWCLTLAAPLYFSSAENQWAANFLDLIPWLMWPPQAGHSVTSTRNTLRRRSAQATRCRRWPGVSSDCGQQGSALLASQSWMEGTTS